MPTFNSVEDANDPLTKLLLKAAPPNEDGKPTLTGLCKELKITRWAMYKWINNQKIPPARVVQIVKVSALGRIGEDGKREVGEPRVKREEFDQYVYTTS